jgi:membrane protein
VKDQVGVNRLSIIAVGVAFYMLLAFVPALAAIVAIYGLFADPATIGDRVAALEGFLPEQALSLVAEQLERLASTSSRSLGLSAEIGLLVSIWSVAKATRSLIDAVNVAYHERETRGFIRLNLIALGLTVAPIVFVIAALALVAIVPLALDRLGLGEMLERTFGALRWVLLLVMLVVAMAVLYRYAPDRDEPRWSWVSPGALVAAALWLAGSVAFSIYESRSDSYDATYGSLGEVAIMMIWLLVGAFALLLGAQVNAETERQTRRDTTEGAERPMGRRDAHAADTLGPAAGGTLTRDGASRGPRHQPSPADRR